MRKFVFAFLFSLALLAPLCAKPLNIVTTVFPAYDWAKNLTQGTDAKITNFSESGIDIHSFQPSVRDIAKISTADIVIFVGGESDGWVKGALKNSRNKNLTYVEFLEILKNELLLEDGAHQAEYDEHVWLSVKKSQKLVEAICAALCKANKSNAALYKTNAQNYLQELKALDKEFSALFDSAKSGSEKTFVFADRFPFCYFASDYGLTCFAAFAGCSAETEASFRTIVFLANKLDEFDLDSVFVIENSDKKIARTIIQNSKNKNRSILTLNTMQSIKAAQKDSTYLGIMRQNLLALKNR